MKSQRFPLLLRLSFPVPGSRSSARAVGRGRGKSQGAAPGPGCWGAAAALPSGPHPGRTGSHGGPNFSARGSRRGRPAAKLPRRLVEIFLNFFFFSPVPTSLPRCPGTFDIVLPGTEPPPLQTKPPVGQRGGEAARRRLERFAPAGDGRNRNPVSSAPPLPARAASPSSGGERRRRRLGVTFRAPFSLPACRGGPRVSQGAELNRD